MTRRQRRATFIIGGVAVIGIALGLVLYALSSTMMYFHTPSSVAGKPIAPGQRFRLGGIVTKGSLKPRVGNTVEFSITDTQRTIAVVFTGAALPDLFREGQGVIAEGALDATGVFHTDFVLAKHDETYMPPEVAKALKEQGVWQGTSSAKADTSVKQK
jgi:cytochrome c-type biogenesis protein CcmE